MSSFPTRQSEPVSQTLSELAGLLGVAAPEPDLEVRGVAPLTNAEPDQLGFLAHRHYVEEMTDSRAGAFLVSEALLPLLPDDSRPRLLVPEAHVALAVLLDSFFPEDPAPPDIHPTAVLGRGVRLGSDVRIGPYAVVEASAEIGDGCRIGAHCVIGEGARVGPLSILHPQVVIYPGASLGRGVILHAGARIGVDGFGYAFHDGTHQKIPQVGTCVVEDDVEIGANATIDRGSIGETRVHQGAKLDNLVHLGHNVVVGPLAVLAGQTGVAGSSRIGAGAMAGGQVGIAGHLTVGEGVKMAAQSGVTRDVPPGETVIGFPARPRTEYLRSLAARGKVPELLRRVRKLEEALASRTGESP